MHTTKFQGYNRRNLERNGTATVCVLCVGVRVPGCVCTLICHFIPKHLPSLYCINVLYINMSIFFSYELQWAQKKCLHF